MQLFEKNIPVNLIIDQGNTRTKLALFEAGELQSIKVAENKDAVPVLGEWLQQNSIEKAILSTVIADSDLVQKLSETNLEWFNLDEHTKLPFKNAYKTPATLGKDRLAAIAGAHQLYPGKPCLVIDAGTAITYDIINSDDVYLGGSITPGLQMRLKAMHHFTSQLPKVEVTETIALPGVDTQTALQTGGFWSVVYEMEGFIRYYNDLHKGLLVFLTGGDALLFDKSIKNSIFVAQNLVLTGLNSLLEYNAH